MAQLFLGIFTILLTVSLGLALPILSKKYFNIEIVKRWILVCFWNGMAGFLLLYNGIEVDNEVMHAIIYGAIILSSLHMIGRYLLDFKGISIKKGNIEVDLKK